MKVRLSSCVSLIASYLFLISLAFSQAALASLNSAIDVTVEKSSTSSNYVRVVGKGNGIIQYALINYRVNSGDEFTLNMAQLDPGKQNDWLFYIQGLSDGDQLDYRIIYNNGVQYESDWHSYVFNKDEPVDPDALMPLLQVNTFAEADASDLFRLAFIANRINYADLHYQILGSNPSQGVRRLEGQPGNKIEFNGLKAGDKVIYRFVYQPEGLAGQW